MPFRPSVPDDTVSRRAVVAALGAATTALAGCSAIADDVSISGPDDPPKPGVDDLPEPGEHVYGADGEWSSFGCNAGNTRTVADGKAPVDGVTERWRAEVSGLTRREPVVAGGRVFQPVGDRLDVYAAADGTKLWSKERVHEPPLLSGGTAYVGVRNRLLALDPKTGEAKWERTFGRNASVKSPSTYGGDWLYVPVDETVHRIDPATGETDWSRRLFGELLGSPAIFMGHYVALATKAGKLYLLGPDGTGAAEWNLDSTPRAPPTADADRVYVSCLDGNVYGFLPRNESAGKTDWQVQTGWADGGLAVQKYVYAAGTSGLHAIDPRKGERVWKRDVGDWELTAPALGRDTLFVGGDKLYAFDPTPGASPFDSGPAKRFEQSFYGRVGPGPVLDDGTLYVVAQTGESSYHLLALE